ncbi:unnamed protein product [Alternaria burnsii]|nr:unnamed protein product [Alternaria burnsii]
MQHTNTKTDQEMRVILIRKEQLLKDIKTCLEAENKMKGKGVPLKIASLLYKRVTFLAAAAILLNLPHRLFIDGIIGGALLLMQLGSQLYVWISTLWGTEVKGYVRLLAKFDENKQGRLRAQLH